MSQIQGKLVLLRVGGEIRVTGGSSYRGCLDVLDVKCLTTSTLSVAARKHAG